MVNYTFRKALPVWAAGKETEKNVSLLLRAELPAGDAVLAVAGHSAYQIFINGEFVAAGPARAGHGYFRVDEIALGEYLQKERSVLCILCAGYNINAFSLTDQPPFVCAEVLAGERVLCATGDAGFTGMLYTARVQKTPRFSFQRTFTECYEFTGEYDRPFTDPAYLCPDAALRVTGAKRFLRQETLRSDYETRPARAVTATGRVTPLSAPQKQWRDRSYISIGPALQGFFPEELACDPVNELYGYGAEVLSEERAPAAPLKLSDGSFAVYDMGLDTTGYICLTAAPETDTVLFAVFNELPPEPPVPDPGDNTMASVVRWALKGGRTYRLRSFEAYTYRYLQVLTLGGAAAISEVRQDCEHYPAAGLKNLRRMPDADLQLIYGAAVETFRQNATDIFMDCPSRERAGWLCDSYFTSRTERALTGESRIEKAFLENFIMEPSFKCLPAGMLPMCYPSDHYDGVYIPNWAMWYLVELAEYRGRTGDEALIARAKEKMYALAKFLEGYENASGLLEKLESWVFVEWSRANDFTQDVNFPTNMLYAKFLEDLGALYGDAAFTEKSARLKQTVRELAFDGTFFADNAVRENGVLVRTGNHTETAQYYAFFTGTASPETYPALWELMKDSFGPERDAGTQYPDVPEANAFIGNYLRLELLYRYGEYGRLLREIRAFFLPMAQTTGTLWEHMHPGASCCHGFASHAAYWLNGLAEKGLL